MSEHVAMKALSTNCAVMKAWNAYKMTPDYANTFRWAEQVEHRDGSMWAAFLEGWKAAGRLPEELVEYEPD